MYFVIYLMRFTILNWAEIANCLPNIHFPLLCRQCAQLGKSTAMIFLKLGQWNVSWSFLENVCKSFCPLALTLFFIPAAWNVVVKTGVPAVILKREVVIMIDTSAKYVRLEREMEFRSLMIALEYLPSNFFHMSEK